MMHMTAAAVSYTMQQHNLVSPMFCATLQLHHGSVMRKLRALVHKYVDESLLLEFRYNEEWAHHKASNEALVKLLCAKHVEPEAAPVTFLMLSMLEVFQALRYLQIF